MLMTYELDFSTQYGQFYLVDKGSKNHTEVKDFWSDQAFSDRLGETGSMLGILIENDLTTVKGRLEILDGPPSELEPEAEHIVETSLVLDSGILELQDCPSSQILVEVPLEKGTYRIRISSYHISEPYGAKNGEVKDRYLLQIWKEHQASEKKVLRQFDRS